MVHKKTKSILDIRCKELDSNYIDTSLSDIIVDVVESIEEQNSEENMKVTIGLFPFRKRYDTYCYSERYNTVPFNAENQFKYYKRNKMLVCPKNRVKKETTDDETLLGGVVVEPPTAPETATN